MTIDFLGRFVGSQVFRRRLVPAVLLASLSVATACGSSGGGSSSGGSSSSSSSSSSGGSSGTSAVTSGGGATSASGQAASAKAAVVEDIKQITAYPAVPSVSGAATALKGKKIWYVPFGASVPVISGFGVNMKEALSKLGATVTVCDGKLQPTQVASCLQEAGQQKADAVVTGFIDYELLPAAFNSLIAAGIPVLVGGEPAPSGRSSTSKLGFLDNSGDLAVMQKAMINAVIADSDAAAHVLYVENTDSPTIAAQGADAVAYLRSHCPACTVKTIETSTTHAQTIPSQVSASLLADPGTNYVISELDAYAAGIASGIQTAGKSASVKLAAANGSLDSLQRVADGTQFADAGSSNAYGGWTWANGVVDMLTGKAPTHLAGIERLFTKQSTAGLDLSPSSYDSIEWYGSASFQQTFLKAWGVS